VTFFLFFFKPFGTKIEPGQELGYLAVCSAFGAVTLVITLMVNGLCALLPQVFAEEKWVLWKEIAFNLFFIGCVGFGNLLLAHFMWEVPINGRTFWVWQGFTLAIGIFPTVIGALLTEMRLGKKYVEEAAMLHPHPVHDITGKPLSLAGENQNERLALEAGQLAYVAAQDNYVQVFYWENGALKSPMLRATLRRIEEQLAEYPMFFRCHRTFLVNFDQVEKISGNAQGYRLHLENIAETIPVSRNLNGEVKKRIGAV
jgi:Response regulator of the LytR/AlgR family